MGGFLLIGARVFLASVLAVSGIAKSVDPAGTRGAIAAFGFPRLATPGAWLLPAVEIALAAALVPNLTAAYAGLGTLALLAGFSVVIAANLRRRHTPECHCFGHLYSAPISQTTLLRNTGLAVVAAAIAMAGWWEPGPSALDLTATLHPVMAGALMVGTLTTATIVGIGFRRNTSAHAGGARRAALPIGVPAPDFTMLSVDGESVSLGNLLTERKPLLAVFVSPTCGPCTAFLPKIEAWQDAHGDVLSFVVISRAVQRENSHLMSALPGVRVLFQGDARVDNAWGVTATPSAVLIDIDSRIASNVSVGAGAIQKLVATILATKSRRTARRLEEEFAESCFVAQQVQQCFGLRIRIRASSTQLLDAILKGLPPLSGPTTPDNGFDFTYSVRDAGECRCGLRHAQAQLFANDQVEAEDQDISHVLERFESAVKMYVAEHAPEHVFVHAGAVGWQGRAIVIPGASMSGKTSLVVELVRAGATYYSDEYAVLDREGRIHPYPQALGIRGSDQFRQTKLDINSIGGTVGRTPLPVQLIIVTQYEAGVVWVPKEISSGQSVLALLSHTVSVRRDPKTALSALQLAGRAGTCLSGSRGESADTARRILNRVT